MENLTHQKSLQAWKVWTFCKRMQNKIDHAHVNEEKCEQSQAGDLKDNKILVVSEECMMVAQDEENMDNEENSTAIFNSVHLSHTQEF